MSNASNEQADHVTIITIVQNKDNAKLRKGIVFMLKYNIYVLYNTNIYVKLERENKVHLRSEVIMKYICIAFDNQNVGEFYCLT